MNGYQQHFRKLKQQTPSLGESDSQRHETPEDIVRKHLRERRRTHNAKMKPMKSDAPLTAIGFLLGGALVLAGVAYLEPESIDDAYSEIQVLVQKVKLPQLTVRFLRPANAAGPEKSAPSSAEKTAGQESSAEAVSPGTEPEKGIDPKQMTSEELKFFKNLNARKEQLDQREAALSLLEEELQKSRKEIEERILELEKMRTQISQTLADRVQKDKEKVAKLVDMYSNMKPAQAAKVIESLNEDLAMDVIEQMKKKNAADVLNAMSAEKAKRLSEMMTGYDRSENRKPSAIAGE